MSISTIWLTSQSRNADSPRLISAMPKMAGAPAFWTRTRSPVPLTPTPRFCGRIRRRAQLARISGRSLARCVPLSGTYRTPVLVAELPSLRREQGLGTRGLRDGVLDRNADPAPAPQDASARGIRPCQRRRVVRGRGHRQQLCGSSPNPGPTPPHTGRRLDIHRGIYATHKTPAVKTWLAAHPQYHLHFTPTSGSWMNLPGLAGRVARRRRPAGGVAAELHPHPHRGRAGGDQT